ncbi:MAG: ATP-binding protein [Deltaproteobacteria bacterium]|nr:ATP-binding protein [Deltaproteobacteria bacterium]
MKLSLAARITLAITTISIFFICGIATFSYLNLSKAYEESSREILESNIKAFADIQTSLINGIFENQTEMSANTLIGNAIVDDLGRDVYLVNFFSGYKIIEGINVQILMTDFKGDILAKNDPKSSLLIDQSWVSEAIDKNITLAVVKNCCGDQYLVITKPIIFANTGLPEGGLIYQFSLKKLLNLKEVKQHIFTSDQITGGQLTYLDLKTKETGTIIIGKKTKNALVESVDLSLNHDLQNIKFSISIFSDKGILQKALESIFSKFLLLGIISIILAFFLSLLISRFLTNRIKELEKNANEIANQSDFSKRLTVRGKDEITSFSKAFNYVLERLEEINRDMENQAQSNIRKLYRAIEQSPVSVVITDLDANIEYVNPKFSKLTGYSFEEVLGQNPRILKSGSQSQDFYHNMWEQLTTKGLWQGELINKKKDGELYTENASISVILDENGKRSHYVAVKENITQRKTYEISLKAAKDEAEKANLAKSSFLANMSHEIRTPMNSILGFAELLSYDSQNSKDRNYLKSIQVAGNTLMVLINDILDLSKIEAGMLDINPEPVDCIQIMNEIEMVFVQKIKEKSLFFEVEIDQDNSELLMIDEFRLKQVLLNLVGNAVKFTENGGIKLVLNITASGEDMVDLKISVIDTGIGIRKEDQNRIFNHFQQQNSKISKKYGGTGLGLTISKQLVKMMNGEITLKSQEGKGSTFILTLYQVPIFKTDNKKPSKEDSFDLHKISFKPYHVLIVDDMEMNRYLVKETLIRCGLKVIEADNGEAAVFIVRERKPDLILMDLRMPIMNGFEATEVIKQDQNLKNIPVIALTASHLDFSEGSVNHKIFNGFLLKPVKIEELVNELKRFLSLENKPVKSNHIKNNHKKFILELPNDKK